MKTPRKAILAVLLLAALALPAAAQEKRDPAKEKISLDLVDVDLRDAIGKVFAGTPLNVVLSDGVAGTQVTMRLDGIERERALKLLLEGRGLEYKKDGDVFLIRPKPAAVTGTTLPVEPLAPNPPVVAPADGSATTGGPVATRSAMPTKIPLKFLDPTDLLYGQGAGMGSRLTGMGQGGYLGYGGYNQQGYGMGYGQPGMGMGMGYWQPGMGMGYGQPGYGMGMGYWQPGMGMGYGQPGYGTTRGTGTTTNPSFFYRR